jgi:hypothetical protein
MTKYGHQQEWMVRKQQETFGKEDTAERDIIKKMNFRPAVKKIKHMVMRSYSYTVIAFLLWKY